MPKELSLKNKNINARLTNERVKLTFEGRIIVKDSSKIRLPEKDIIVVGNYAYLGTFSEGLQIIDISDPTKPVLVANLKNSFTWSMADSENYIYVASASQGLKIFDVSNPSSPMLKGVYPDPVSSATVGVAAAGNVITTYNWDSDDTFFIRVIDVSNITQPIFKGVIPIETRPSVIRNNNAYALGASYLSIINISDLTQPSFQGSYEIPMSGYGSAVTVVENIAYIAAGSIGLDIVDVSNSTGPIRKGNYTVPGSYANDIVAIGKTAYIAGGDKGVQVLDVSDPVKPMLVGIYDTSASCVSIALSKSGRFIYIKEDTSSDLFIFTVLSSERIHPKLIFSLSDISIFDVTMHEDYLYLAKPAGELDVIDVHKPSQPILIGKYVTPSPFFKAALSRVKMIGNNVYVVTTDFRLHIIDIANPAYPKWKGSFYNSPWSTESLDVVNNLAYIVGNSKLSIIDISYPDVPTLKGRYDSSSLEEYDFKDVVVVKNYAYLVNRGYQFQKNGLRIVDVSNSTYPVLVGSFNIPGSAIGIAVEKNIAYITAGSAGLQMIDVSEVTRPVLKGNYVTAGAAKSVVVRGNYAYVVSQGFGLDIVDVSRPTSAAYAGHYEMPSAKVIVLRDRKAYLAGQDLLVLDEVIPSQEPFLVNNHLVTHKGRTRTLTSRFLSATDADNPASELVFKVSNVYNGYFASTINRDASISSFSQSAITDNQIVFVHDGSDEIPAYRVTVDDGHGAVPFTPAEATITFVTTPPFLENNTLSIVQGQGKILSSTDIGAITAGEADPELIFTINNVTHARFERGNNPGIAITRFMQQEVSAGLIHFVHDGSYQAPAYTVAVEIGALKAFPETALVSFNEFPKPNDDTIRKAIISSVVSGAVGLVFLVAKLGITYCVDKRLKKAFEQGETLVERQRAKYYREVIKPVVNKLFDQIKTTSFFGYRSEKDTKAYVTAIEQLVLKLHEQGVELDMEQLSPQKQTRLFHEVVRQAKRILVSSPSVCSKAYLGSFFKPEVKPTEIEDKSDEIARAVYDALQSRESTRSTPSLAKVDNVELLDLLLEPAKDEKSSLSKGEEAESSIALMSR